MNTIKHQLQELTPYQAITGTLYTICALILIWGFMSVMDVAAHNTTSCTYATWNFFNLF